MPILPKMVALLSFAKFIKDAFYLASILQLHKYQVFILINMRNKHKGQKHSSKLRLHKRLLKNKWPAESEVL